MVNTSGLYQQKTNAPVSGDTPDNYFRREENPIVSTATEIDAAVAVAGSMVLDLSLKLLLGEVPTQV